VSRGPRESSLHGRAGRHVRGTNVSNIFMLRCSFQLWELLRILVNCVTLSAYPPNSSRNFETGSIWNIQTIPGALSHNNKMSWCGPEQHLLPQPHIPHRRLPSRLLPDNFWHRRRIPCRHPGLQCAPCHYPLPRPCGGKLPDTSRNQNTYQSQGSGLQHPSDRRVVS
jgi:hypothetical protein